MEKELLAQRILESTALEIVVLDAELKVSEVNTSFCELTGLDRVVLLGQSAACIWERGGFERLRRLLVENIAFAGELSEKSAFGPSRPMHYTFSPIRDDSDTIEAFVGLGRPLMQTDRYEQELRQRIQQIRQTQGVALVGLAKLAEYRDTDTGQHLERMRNYSRIVAEDLSTQDEYLDYITDEYIEGIYNSSPLHDIGKVGIPDAILLKPGRLTPQEFEIMKMHSQIGGDALEAADRQLDGESFLTMGKEIAYHHHEKWDGSGYPDGMTAEQIPLSARIVAIADVYDALTSKRVYKDAIAHDRARAIIIEGSGQHFAPDVVRAFLKRERDILGVREQYKD
ncbi:MAG TPA: HD domain-containing phosphohydrolase [bacterium]